MKGLFLISAILLTCFVANAQFGYKDKLESKDGIEIGYKIVHTKHFDKESPAQLRLKLKNTNEYPVNLKFEIEYTTGMTKRYSSGGVEICFPSKTARTGKMHGLVFELNTTDVQIFSTDNAEWEFSIFDVVQIEECKQSSK